MNEDYIPPKNFDSKIRTFKIININDQDYSDDIKLSKRYYRGKSPLIAASHAFSKLNKYLNQEKDNFEATFILKETTRDSENNEYGPYYGKFIKLDKQKIIIRHNINGNMIQYAVNYSKKIGLKKK